MHSWTSVSQKRTSHAPTHLSILAAITPWIDNLRVTLHEAYASQSPFQPSPIGITQFESIQNRKTNQRKSQDKSHYIRYAQTIVHWIPSSRGRCVRLLDHEIL